ncbi:MAG: TlpA family protein disulfide reductase [Flavobacterium sp.]|nr:TlpA family protein disulfide reductase [Flavobacterium sp.]
MNKNAPNFSAKTPDGKLISLKQAMGKVTIIDFWASWCGPCRSENPNVVALYKKFHAKGLNIIGVSLDNNVEKWKQAILKDGLSWIHVSNLKEWNDPIAKIYEVNQIPSTFLLDASGKIIAVDLRGPDLESKISILLSQK